MNKEDVKPAKLTTIYKRYRVPADTYKIISKPTEGRPKEWMLQPDDDFWFHELAARGGKVVCRIIDGSVEGVGVAICSFSDVFSKRYGYELAYSRAVLALHMAKSLDIPATDKHHFSVTVEPPQDRPARKSGCQKLTTQPDWEF